MLRACHTSTYLNNDAMGKSIIHMVNYWGSFSAFGAKLVDRRLNIVIG